jgi:hypothetical protein
MMTLASAWQDISSALAHLESVDRVYIYLLTSHGDLLPVHPLPEAGADLRAATPPSTAELVAKLNEAVRTDQASGTLMSRTLVCARGIRFRHWRSLYGWPRLRAERI